MQSIFSNQNTMKLEINKNGEMHKYYETKFLS